MLVNSINLLYSFEEIDQEDSELLHLYERIALVAKITQLVQSADKTFVEAHLAPLIQHFLIIQVGGGHQVRGNGVIFLRILTRLGRLIKVLEADRLQEKVGVGAEKRIQVRFDLSRLFLGAYQHEKALVVAEIHDVVIFWHYLVGQQASKTVIDFHRIVLNNLVAWV